MDHFYGAAQVQREDNPMSYLKYSMDELNKSAAATGATAAARASRPLQGEYTVR